MATSGRDADPTAACLTIGRLARQFGLSRSTLLYYDRLGLLCPAGRSTANYRLYGEEDRRRLELICRYREAGVPLEEIGRILSRAGDGAAADTGGASGEDDGARAAEILERRLEQLNAEVERLREQQRVVVRLLRDRKRYLGRARTMDKKRWVEILRATGLDEEDMRRWHVEFERMSPEAHGDFLESLGIPAAEIEQIREWSRNPQRKSRRPS